MLKILIEKHIIDGQPVGSRTLSRGSGLELSPATVRNVMADLEEMGFLQSPHTSAGRVPTVRGYRFFVDTLLSGPLPQDQMVEQLLRSQLRSDQNVGDLVQSASTVLSSFTQLASIVTLPKHDTLVLRHVEFLPLSEQRVLAILVINEQEVQNRIVLTERDYSQAELQQAANFLNEQFAGRDIAQVRAELLAQMQADRQSMNDLMNLVIDVADKAFESEQRQPNEDFVVDGQTNLIGVAELSDLEKLRQLFDAFNRKRDMLHLFDQSMSANGVQIFIGSESGYDVLDECSVVTAPYTVDGKALGVLGVIGPTRMAYDRVIPIVEVTAKLLASILALNSRH